MKAWSWSQNSSAAEPMRTASRRPSRGLGAQVAGRSLADWASDLGAIAERGLKACLPDDLDKISPLLERIEDGRSPADDLLDAWNTDPSQNTSSPPARTERTPMSTTGRAIAILGAKEASEQRRSPQTWLQNWPMEDHGPSYSST